MEQVLTNLAALLAFLQQHFIPSFIFVLWHLFVFIPGLLFRQVFRQEIVISLPSGPIKLGIAFIAAIMLGYILDNMNFKIMELFQGHPVQQRWLGRWRRLSKWRWLGADRLMTKLQAKKRILIIRRLDEIPKEIKEIRKNQSEQAVAQQESELKINELEKEIEQIRKKQSKQAAAQQESELKINELKKATEEIRQKQSKQAADQQESELKINELVLENAHLQRQLNLLFSSGYILPTTLGNVIQSFQNIPFTHYGIDATILYPRLEVALAKYGHDKVVRQEKIRVDFFLDSSLLSVIFAGECLVGLLAHHEHSGDWSQAFLLQCLGSLLLSRLCYKAAVAGAFIWGTSIQTAFDFYRYDLLRLLNCKPPANFKEEKQLWFDISGFLRDWRGAVDTDEQALKLDVDAPLPATGLAGEVPGGSNVLNYERIKQTITQTPEAAKGDNK